MDESDTSKLASYLRRFEKGLLPAILEVPDFLGGPGRTRTCNQTVMSGRLSISFVDFAAFLFDFDRVRYVLMRLFLVRNWCGASEA
jgi:hypothetical protein